MAKIDDEAPLEQNYEILGTAIERALAKLQLAAEQLRAAKATLDGSIELLGEVELSEEAEADCNVDLMVAQMMSSRALSNSVERVGAVERGAGLRGWRRGRGRGRHRLDPPCSRRPDESGNRQESQAFRSRH